MKCRYCNRKTESEFCSFEHKKAFYTKEENVFIQLGATAISKKLSDAETLLQEQFIKKIGKRKAKVKLPISYGN